MSGNCIGKRIGAKLSCKLAYSREGIPKSPFKPTVVVILESGRKPLFGEVYSGSEADASKAGVKI